MEWRGELGLEELNARGEVNDEDDDFSGLEAMMGVAQAIWRICIRSRKEDGI